jgi:hypothetical protein
MSESTDRGEVDALIELAGDHFWFLLKDPHWAFLWWELSPTTTYKIKENRTTTGDTELWLRVHDVTDILFNGQNSHWYLDLQVQGNTGHWYLRVPSSNRVYCAELGCKRDDGQYRPLLRSDPVFVPRSGPSDWFDERWADITV